MQKKAATTEKDKTQLPKQTTPTRQDHWDRSAALLKQHIPIYQALHDIVDNVTTPSHISVATADIVNSARNSSYSSILLNKHAFVSNEECERIIEEAFNTSVIEINKFSCFVILFWQVKHMSTFNCVLDKIYDLLGSEPDIIPSSVYEEGSEEMLISIIAFG